MLRAMRRELETGLRRLLHGHAGGNSGHSQGVAYGLPRQFPTLPTGGRYIGARPSNAAIARIKARIRQHLRSGNQAPWQEVAAPLNRTVRGWATYFTYGSVTKARSGVQRYLHATVRRFLCRRHRVKGGGYRQFPDTRVCGELGVFSFAAPSR
jgi:hypothetical protein